MHLAVVMKLSTALLQMLNLVETYVLNIQRKTLLHSNSLYVSHKYTRSVNTTNVLFERGGY